MIHFELLDINHDHDLNSDRDLDHAHDTDRDLFPITDPDHPVIIIA